MLLPIDRVTAVTHNIIGRGIFYARGATVDLLTLILADHASFDENKKLNLMGAFNELHSKRFPALHPSMVIVSRLAASPAEAGTTRKMTIKILDEDGKTELMNYTRDVEVKPALPGRRSNIDGILRVNTILFPKPGTYQVSVLIDGDEKGSIPLYVVQDEQ